MEKTPRRPKRRSRRLGLCSLKWTRRLRGRWRSGGVGVGVVVCVDGVGGGGGEAVAGSVVVVSE
jgi:hypothetical protein